MIKIHVLKQLFLLTVLSATVVSLAGKQTSTSNKYPSGPIVQGCLSEKKVSSAVGDLSFGKTYEVQQRAVALLRENANRSTSCRSQVITNLVSAMDQPNLDLTGGKPHFYLWHYGTRLLGELKAVEVLDLLIANFDRDDGTPFPFNHHPALGGIVDMGEIALPKLQTVLRNNPDRIARRYSVFCIALIGGSSAKEILRQALEGESDPCVAECIRASLTAFANKRRPYYVSDDVRTKWYSSFLCNGE